MCKCVWQSCVQMCLCALSRLGFTPVGLCGLARAHEPNKLLERLDSVQKLCELEKRLGSI